MQRKFRNIFLVAKIWLKKLHFKIFHFYFFFRKKTVFLNTSLHCHCILYKFINIHIFAIFSTRYAILYNICTGVNKLKGKPEILIHIIIFLNNTLMALRRCFNISDCYWSCLSKFKTIQSKSSTVKCLQFVKMHVLCYKKWDDVFFFTLDEVEFRMNRTVSIINCIIFGTKKQNLLIVSMEEEVCLFGGGFHIMEQLQ